MKTMSIVFAAALASTLFAAAPTLKPGQYEIVREFSVAGQPGRMPPQKMQHCYTRKDVEDVAKLVAGQAAEKNCKVLSSKVAGATLTLTTECANGDGSILTIAGEMTFISPESFRSVVNMKQVGGVQDETTAMLNNSTITSTAKRIGECSK